MLVLTRPVDGKILIGDDIEIVVVGIKGKQVKIGVKAPRDVVVNRADAGGRIERDAQTSDSPPLE